MKEFIREKVTIMKINLKFLQMLHRGKLLIDSLNINLYNFECQWWKNLGTRKKNILVH